MLHPARLSLLLVPLLLSSCVVAIGDDEWDWSAEMADHRGPGPREIAERNRRNLEQLEPGMTYEAVYEVMGHDHFESARLSNPYRTESFPLEAGGRAQVLYYYTDRNTGDGRVEDDELTPLWFQDGLLLGWGRTAFESWKAGVLSR